MWNSVNLFVYVPHIRWGVAHMYSTILADRFYCTFHFFVAIFTSAQVPRSFNIPSNKPAGKETSRLLTAASKFIYLFLSWHNCRRHASKQTIKNRRQRRRRKIRFAAKTTSIKTRRKVQKRRVHRKFISIRVGKLCDKLHK